MNVTERRHHHIHWVFVSKFWDTPLEGIVEVDGKLYSANIISGTKGRRAAVRYRLAELRGWQKVKRLAEKVLFELCVGYHWSDFDTNTRPAYRIRRPIWFWLRVQDLYYWVDKIKRRWELK